MVTKLLGESTLGRLCGALQYRVSHRVTYAVLHINGHNKKRKRTRIHDEVSSRIRNEMLLETRLSRLEQERELWDNSFHSQWAITMPKKITATVANTAAVAVRDAHITEMLEEKHAQVQVEGIKLQGLTSDNLLFGNHDIELIMHEVSCHYCMRSYATNTRGRKLLMHV